MNNLMTLSLRSRPLRCFYIWQFVELLDIEIACCVKQTCESGFMESTSKQKVELVGKYFKDVNQGIARKVEEKKKTWRISRGLFKKWWFWEFYKFQSSFCFPSAFLLKSKYVYELLWKAGLVPGVQAYRQTRPPYPPSCPAQWTSTGGSR